MKRRIGVFLLAALFLAAGCKKKAAPASANNGAGAILDTVYVAGGLFAPDASGLWTGHAILWKNGVPTALTTGYSMATSITLNDGDVYVTGLLSTGTGLTRAAYWKNGNAVVLTDGQTNARAMAIAIDGNDVYVVGQVDGPGVTVATWWKNGVQMALTANTLFSTANGIAVSGGDVYVVGQFMNGHQDSSTVMIWKNGVALPYTCYPFSYATCIAMVDTNRYIGGTSSTGGGWGNTVTCWKNEVLQVLDTGLTGSQVNGIAVSGADVYAVGSTMGYEGETIAGYWKNGQPVSLAGSILYSYASGVAIEYQDVYICGGTNTPTGHDHAIYWKNGVPVMLTEGATSTGLYTAGIAAQVSRLLYE